MRRPTQLKVCRHRVNNVLNVNTIHFARMVQHKKKVIILLRLSRFSALWAQHPSFQRRLRTWQSIV